MTSGCVTFGLELINAIFSFFVICPLVVSFWVGAWALADLYLFPEDLYLSALASAAGGILIPFVFTVSRDYLQDKVARKDRKILYHVVSRCYNLLFGCASVLHWRSLWILLDNWKGFSYVSAFSSILIGLAGLIPLKCLRNTVSSPLYVARDLKSGSFAFHTLFDIQAKNNLLVCMYDACFGIIIVGYFIVFLWRGVFCLLDIALIPGNLDLSATVSLMIGYGSAVLAIILQRPVAAIAEKLDGTKRLAVLDALSLLGFTSSVSTWRGWWNIYPRYVLPEQPLKANLLMATIGFVGLSFLNASQSCMNKGIYEDGQEPGGQSAFLSYKYFRDLDITEESDCAETLTLTPSSTPDTEIEFLYERVDKISVV